MNYHYIREAAKVGVGLVLADLISVFWFSGIGWFPVTVIGITWTADMAPVIAVFDIALLIILSHHAWHLKLPVSSPSEKNLLMASAVLFLIVAGAHLARLLFGADLILGDFLIPKWLSWFGLAVTGYLSYSCFHFALKKH